MSSDDETIAVYETSAHRYAELVGRAAQPGYTDFIAELPEGAHVLDLGCGPGDTAVRLLKSGFTVDAVDATPAMVSRARELGVDARQATFDEITGHNIYDGVWASFSLLHAPRAAFPAHLARLHKALKPGGKLHLGMKLGTGEQRDDIGRFYSYYSEAELIAALEAAGFMPTIRETSESVGLDGKMAQVIWMHANG